MARLRSFLDQFWTDSLLRLRDAAEAAERAGDDRAIDEPTNTPNDKEH
jgi:hypothetical protein